MRSSLLSLLTAALSLPVLAAAADSTWLGTADGSWNNGSNWSALPGAGDGVIFSAGAGTYATTVDGSFSLSGIVVDATASSAVTIANGSGGAISLGGGGIDLSAATQNLTFNFTANSLLTLTANQTWNVGTGRELTFSGNSGASASRTFDLGGNTVTRTGGGTTYIGGGIGLSNGTFDLQGGLTILRGDGNQSSTPNTVDFKVGSDAILRVTRTGSPAYAFFSDIEINGGTLELAGAQNHNIQGVISGTGGVISGALSNNVNKTFTNSFTGSGTFDFQNGLTGTSVIILSGDNSGFSGTFNVNGTSGSRRVRLDSASSGSASATWNVAADNLLIVAAGGSGAVFGTLNTSGTTTLTGAATVNDGIIAAGGLIEGTAGLTVNDSLIVNGTLSTTITLGTGASLGGTGTINTALQLFNGNSLAPGNSSIGTLAVGDNVALFSGAQLTIEIDSDNTLFDVLNFTGVNNTLYFDNGAELLIVNTGSSSLEGTYQIITGANIIDLGLILSGDSAYSYALNSSGLLTITAIPEPSTYALFGAAGVVGLLALRRKRR